MIENDEHTTEDEFRGARLGMFGTHSNNSAKVRIFVCTKTGWFERLKSESGEVAFNHIAQSEDELRDFVLKDDPWVDLVSLGHEQRMIFSQEFREQQARDSHERRTNHHTLTGVTNIFEMA